MRDLRRPAGSVLLFLGRIDEDCDNPKFPLIGFRFSPSEKLIATFQAIYRKVKESQQVLQAHAELRIIGCELRMKLGPFALLELRVYGSGAQPIPWQRFEKSRI
jgi:hypothetical protein